MKKAERTDRVSQAAGGAVMGEDFVRYQDVVVGFGKSGKLLAAEMAKRGRKVLLVEKDAGRFGGTCINVACIPTKILERWARSGRNGLSDAEHYRKAVETKNVKISALRAAN